MVKPSRSEQQPAEATVTGCFMTVDGELSELADEMSQRLHLGSARGRACRIPSAAAGQVGGTRSGRIVKEKKAEKSRSTLNYFDTKSPAFAIWERIGKGLTAEEIAERRSLWLEFSGCPVPAWMEPGAAEAAAAEFASVPPDVQLHLNAFRPQYPKIAMKILPGDQARAVKSPENPNLSAAKIKRRKWFYEKKAVEIRDLNQKIEALELLSRPEQYK